MRFIKRLPGSVKKIFLLFSVWRITLFAIAYLAIVLIPKWGGRYPYWDTVLDITRLPSWVWSFGGFDGVHYLRIAQDWYSSANSQAFFPLYPLLIKFFNVLPKNSALDLRVFVDPSYFHTGLILSNVFFFFAILYFYKLLRRDFNKKVSFWSVILLLLFPTSFFFGAIYSESLFLLLTVASIYYARKRNFLLAGILAGLASATRILGLALLPLIFVEFYLYLKSGKKIAIVEKIKSILGMIVAPAGAVLYMIYLKITAGNYLYFLAVQPGFGAERSAQPFILLPQVIYRYLKIFLTVYPISIEYLNAVLEFVFALVPILLLVLFWKKMRLSYWLFTLVVLILPTLTGTFSSMPRYALMGFLLFPWIASRLGKYFVFVSIILGFLGAILVALFTRGYWVA